MRLDPVDFEVLRHRVWAINDEAAATVRRISGSPVATEALDYNNAILTGDGRAIYVGTRMGTQAACMDHLVRHVLATRATNPGICPGDMFLCNDPYVGVLHQPDMTLIMPIFRHDLLIAWSGCTIHQVDVGGPVSGGFAVGAASIFDEPPPVPPIRIVEAGTLRRDIEEAYLRHSRTPDQVAMDLRAQIAANRRTDERLQHLMDRYGRDTLAALYEDIIDYTRTRLGERLRLLPDGVYNARSYMEHDGLADHVYRTVLAMTKHGEQIMFDFRASDDQAPALINCTRPGLRGGVLAAILPLLCYDLPWCPAGIDGLLRILSRPGSVVDAVWPAGVSMGSVAGVWTALVTCNEVIGRMLALSGTHADHATAVWRGCFIGQNVFGLRRDGMPFGSMITDSIAGGAGATGERDGVDSGGGLSAMEASIANVETNERTLPIRYLFRRQVPDSGGPGRFRGGVGAEHACVLVNAQEVQLTQFAQGTEYPPSSGVEGGDPGGSAALRIGEDQVPHPKVVLRLREGQVFHCRYPGGGGFGDPLERDPERVALDVRSGLVSRGLARTAYGVVIRDDGSVGWPETETERRGLRCERLAREPEEPQTQASSASSAITIDGPRLLCGRCRAEVGSAGEGLGMACVRRRLPVDGTRGERLPNRFEKRETYCPKCGRRLDVQVALASDPPLVPWHALNRDEGA